jgi:predicted nucleic acid-binding protein
MILLDTNICVYIINAKPPAVLARFLRATFPGFSRFLMRTLRPT